MTVTFKDPGKTLGDKDFEFTPYMEIQEDVVTFCIRDQTGREWHLFSFDSSGRGYSFEGIPDGFGIQTTPDGRVKLDE